MIFGKLLSSDRGGAVLLVLLALACVIVPVCSLLVPESSVFHLQSYAVTLLGKYLCFALLALALDLGRSLDSRFKRVLWPLELATKTIGSQQSIT